MSLIALAKYSAPETAHRAPQSIFKTMAAAEQRDFGTKGSSPAGEMEAKKQEYVEKVVQHIPSEAVGFYIFAAGLFQSVSSSDRLSATDGRSIVFYLTLVITPVLAWYLVGKRLEEEKVPHPYRPRKEHRWKMFAATLAFVVWAAAMPASIFAG